MIEQNLILLVVLLPFVAALVAATLPVNAHDAAAWLSGLALCAALVALFMLRAPVEAGQVPRAVVPWVPSLRLNLSFRLDGFSWLMAALVLAIGVLVVVYARYYLARTDPVPRFYSFLMAFAGAMNGMVLSGNILMLVVFWELTSLISFLLIGYWHQNQAARDGARMSLVITACGGFCLLAAMLVLGQIAGSHDLDRVLGAGPAIRADPRYRLALILFLLGCFTKSAQVPFHFWLPGAMAAPTPVSSYLHSATMVKAGVFLLIRFSPALGGTAEWFWLVAGTGMATLVFGALVALFRHDLKGLLAYSTISNLGLITALAGIGSAGAVLAAIFHIVNHAVFKASLFMAAGIIDHETGTRDMRRLSGLFRFMPYTGTLAIVACAAMAGVPLLNGFISKEMFFAEAADWHNGSWLDNSMPWLATLAGAFAVAYSARFILTVFFGPPPRDLPKVPHEPTPWMRLPVEALVLACLVVGILPATTLGPMLAPALHAVAGPQAVVHDIALWHGFTTPLMMSTIAMLAGMGLYLMLGRWIDRGPEGPPLLHRLRAQPVYEWLLLRLSWSWPAALLRRLEAGRLQPQLRLIVLAGLGAGLWIAAGAPRPGLPPIARPSFTLPASPNPLEPAFALVWLLGGAAAIGAAWQAKYHRFAALILLAAAGMATCLTFAWASAPDLALTQLLVEVVTTVLLLLGLRWLPKRHEEIAGDRLPAARLRRARDLLIALAAGGGLAALAWVAMTRPHVPGIGDWFLRNAWYEGGGTNAVNVILVDFRAFDTFGEITVLAVVGLTVFALLRRFRPAPDAAAAPRQQRGPAAEALQGRALVPSVIMRWMFPVTIVMAAYLFLRGHDLPGGGFSAGVTLSIGLLLQYIASGVRAVEARIVIRPVRWMGLGLLVAGAAGAAAMLAGYPFLSALARDIDLPLLGAVPATTAMLFDAGVFALVLGATVLMLIAIAHQSLRATRPRPTGEAADAGPAGAGDGAGIGAGDGGEGS